MKIRSIVTSLLILTAVVPVLSANESPSESTEKANHHAESEHEEGGEEESSNSIGPDKAVTEASKKLGLKLSQKAIQTLSIRTLVIQSQGVHRLPPKAIVYFQDETGIYREKDGWYKLIEVEIGTRAGSETTVKSSELKPGDHIVIDGVPLLRIAELNAFGGAGEGHGH